MPEKYLEVAIWFLQQHARGLTILGLVVLLLVLLNAKAEQDFKRDVIIMPEYDDED